MLDRSDRQFFSGNDVNGLINTLLNSLYSAGLPVQQTGPNTWKARGTVPSYGMVPVVSIVAMPTPQGFCVDARCTVDIEGSGIAIFVVLWLVFFPAAIILGIMAYNALSPLPTQVLQVMWTPVQHLFIAPNYAPPFAAASQGNPPAY